MIDSNEVLKDLGGVALTYEEGTEEHSLTVGYVISRILITEQPSSDPLRSYMLAQSIYSGEEIKDADIAFIKKSVTSTKMYLPIVIGQLLNLLK